MWVVFLSAWLTLADGQSNDVVLTNSQWHKPISGVYSIPQAWQTAMSNKICNGNNIRVAAHPKLKKYSCYERALANPNSPPACYDSTKDNPASDALCIDPAGALSALQVAKNLAWSVDEAMGFDFSDKTTCARVYRIGITIIYLYTFLPS